MFADFDPLDLKPGQMVSHWRIVRRIGRGGYAVVYEVEKDGQRFALKVACQTERSFDPKQTDARARGARQPVSSYSTTATSSACGDKAGGRTRSQASTTSF